MNRQEMVEAYEGGCSVAEIAMFSGKSFSTVHYHLKKAGVEFRSRTAHLGDHVGTDRCAKGHIKVNGKCQPCNTARERERYQTDPEFAERRREASRRWKQNRKERNEDA